jgi:hypothetical protein
VEARRAEVQQRAADAARRRGVLKKAVHPLHRRPRLHVSGRSFARGAGEAGDPPQCVGRRRRTRLSAA